MAASSTSSFYSGGWSSDHEDDADGDSTVDTSTDDDDNSGSEEDCFLTSNLEDSLFPVTEDLEENISDQDSDSSFPDTDEFEPESISDQESGLNSGDEETDENQSATSGQHLEREEFFSVANENSKVVRRYTSSEYENVTSDFRDAEIFLIDGDSLLFELVCEEQTLSWSGGGQYLHLAYIVERFLQLFIQKGGNFHIIFFKEMEKVWYYHSDLALARRCIILHLEHNTKLTLVTNIESCWSPEWQEYIETNRPTFMLLAEADWTGKMKIPRMFLEEMVLFQSLLLKTLCLELNCVYIGGIDFQAAGAHGFYVQPTLQLKRSLHENHSRIMNVCKLVLEHRQKAFEQNFIQNLCFLNREAIQEPLLAIPFPGGLRAALYTMSVADLILCSLKDHYFDEEAWPFVFGAMKIFILHVVLLRTLPLKYRAQPNRTKDVEQFKIGDGKVNVPNILKRITRELRLRLSRSLDLLNQTHFRIGEHNFNDELCFVADIFDGRLFLTLLTECLTSCTKGKEVSVPPFVLEETQYIWHAVIAIVNSRHKQFCEEKAKQPVDSTWLPLFNFPVTFIPSGVEECKVKVQTPVTSEGLMPLNNKLVEKFAGETRATLKTLELNPIQEKQLINSGREFDEKYHWHSLRPLSDDYDRTKDQSSGKLDEDPRERKKQLRNRQTYKRFMQFYADSVEGKKHAKVIIANKKPITFATNRIKKATNYQIKGPKKGKQKPKKSDIIKAENLQKKKDQQEKDEHQRWLNYSSNLKKMSDFQAILSEIDKFISGCEVASVKVIALMKKAEMCFEEWKGSWIESQGKKSEKNLTPAIQLFSTVQCLIADYGSDLKETQKKTLAKYMHRLGFDDIASHIFPSIKDSSKCKEGSSMTMGMSSARFQLEKMGHLLRRDIRTDPDPRVDGFIPDTWQRELLDVVDNNESALIVAPTSSGKTYVSYYCMEKVLRESDDGIVVYVSPTKALVNQVAATVFARFHLKKLPPGKTVYGVFTRDYRHEALNCQILVTVPQCLEILLLSPHRQDWASKIKYAIFDEVHCLGSEIGAEVWEHLLLLIRCPLLALSATIGNPNDLHRWLQASQLYRKQQDEASGATLRNSYRVRLITYKERFSDLEKSVYLPKPENGCYDAAMEYTEKYDDCSGTEEFHHLHPCAVLSSKQLATKGFPSDLTLTPSECVQLFDAMEHFGKDESISALKPEIYFTEKLFITKADVRRYESDLKERLLSWVSEGNFHQVDLVIRELGSDLEGKTVANTFKWERQDVDVNDESFVMVNILKLIEQLKAQKKLPALFFSFNRQWCENSVKKVARTLRYKEQAIRQGPMKKKLDQLKAQFELHRKKLEKQKDLKVIKVTKEDLQDKGDQPNFSLLSEPLPSCTFANLHLVAKKDREKVLGRIWPDTYLYSSFMAGIRRGLSFHHGGLNAKYRAATEVLFRSKFLQVVVATGTLALGIHMPCKTVVFLGDNIYLNSLNYRQMSGRSGRRGFDPIGNVVFYGVPLPKICRLLNAEVPSLHGNFPLTVSLVLRLMLLVAKSDKKQDAEDKAMSLLEYPFLCYPEPHIRSQIKHHFLFSCEFLVRQGFLDLEGVPQEMSGLVTHLHYHEPSNFIFVYFLQKGLFHHLCKGISGKITEEVMREIVLVLSHLFGRRKLRQSQYQGTKFSSSKVKLEEMPGPFKEALQVYNTRAVDVFGLYLRTLGDKIKAEHGEEKQLPLSGVVFPDSASFQEFETEGPTEDSVVEAIKKAALPYSAYSAFSALSGNTDSDLKEHRATDVLLKTIRPEVFTDSKILPVFPETDFVGRRTFLNAYALDFFKHGSEKAIRVENGLKHGETFHALKDFYLTIQAISVSLEELGPEGSKVTNSAATSDADVIETSTDPVINAFKALAVEYRKRFNNAFGIVESSY